MTDDGRKELAHMTFRWVFSDSDKNVSYCISSTADIYARMQTSLRDEYDTLVSLFKGVPEGLDNLHYTKRDKVFRWITHAMDYAEEQVSELANAPLPDDW
jgi:hypothetical protein